MRDGLQVWVLFDEPQEFLAEGTRLASTLEVFRNISVPLSIVKSFVFYLYIYLR